MQQGPKLGNVKREMEALTKTADTSLPDDISLRRMWEALYRINKELWAIEDDIRACEARGDFGPAFIALARAVYVTNDKRAKVKKDINLHLGSALVEEKSYVDPKGGL